MDVAGINPLTLPSVRLLQRQSLPDCPAIYFVLNNKQVLYIGRATNLLKQWSSHHKTPELEIFTNAKIAWLECSDSMLLLRVERTLIRTFKPPLNETHLLASNLAVLRERANLSAEVAAFRLSVAQQLEIRKVERLNLL